MSYSGLCPKHGPFYGDFCPTCGPLPSNFKEVDLESWKPLNKYTNQTGSVEIAYIAGEWWWRNLEDVAKVTSGASHASSPDIAALRKEALEAVKLFPQIAFPLPRCIELIQKLVDALPLTKEAPSDIAGLLERAEDYLKARNGLRENGIPVASHHDPERIIRELLTKLRPCNEIKMIEPCMFCGEEKELSVKTDPYQIERIGGPPDQFYKSHVECGHCGARGSSMVEETKDDAIAEATQSWNGTRK